MYHSQILFALLLLARLFSTWRAALIFIYCTFVGDPRGLRFFLYFLVASFSSHSTFLFHFSQLYALAILIFGWWEHILTEALD